ncbi:MAG: UDP-2,3-diacylglucosamine diphosphatase [Gammaproteobacteria bacterium]|nr:UDP-2,3-diacylglucosamine diphosphatase [Gammaproteobacteria bacterium]
MHRVYISDLHLSSSEEPAFRTLRALLERESRRVDAIYILGDLCEMWVGDDDDSSFADALRDALADAGRHTQLRIMHGNRDFLLGESFAAACDCELIGDPYPAIAGTLLAHGDAFCIDDQEYQQVRSLLRSAAWQEDVLGRSLDERRVLAQGMRDQSKATNANKAENIMDVSSAEVARIAAQQHVSTIIHGHTHRPGVHEADWGTRYVLGAWEHCGWLLRETDTVTQLECFALTGRYET